MATLDHISLPVPSAQFDSIVAFYEAALAPIGFSKQMEFPGQAVGFGASKHSACFWLGAKGEVKGDNNHVAFRATNHETVDKFHEAAIKAGGTCNGKPGLRTHYHPSYYGAFVLDPLGNNIEVVDHTPVSA